MIDSFGDGAAWATKWGLLPDVAETIVRLVERGDELGPFRIFHMEGWIADGKLSLPVKAVPWWLKSGLARLDAVPRDAGDALTLKSSALHKRSSLGLVPGREPPTQLESAVCDTLRGIGCIRR
jgi:hypothetical protein